MAEEFVSLTTHETVPYVDTKIVHIVDKVVHSFEDQLSLKGESYSQYIVFEIDRYYDGIDLTDGLLLQITYLRADGKGDNCPAVNVSYSDEHVRFAWLVPPAATVIPGKLKVMPFAYGEIEGKKYILKTAYVEYTIRDAIELEEFVDEPGDEWYKQFLDQILMIDDFSTSIQDSLSASKKAMDAADTAVSAANAAKEYQSQADASAQAAAASVEEAKQVLSQMNFSLGIDETDKLLYIYVNGEKQGTGIDLGSRAKTAVVGSAVVDTDMAG